MSEFFGGMRVSQGTVERTEASREAEVTATVRKVWSPPTMAVDMIVDQTLSKSSPVAETTISTCHVS
ncbi:MAG: hypothetical protein P4L57_02895 [Rhizomicrobium sp.]|nr:hypothetical protein [Rhizomicrobium sp.]